MDSSPSEGLFVYATKEGGERNYGYLDAKSGEVVVPASYADAKVFSEGYAYVMDSKKNKMFIDKKGKVVLGPDAFKGFEHVDQFFHEGLIVVTNKNWKSGYMDIKGKMVIPFKFDDANSFKKGVAVVGKEKEDNEDEHLFGLIDKTGNLILDYTYDEIEDFSAGLARVEKDEKYGYIDATGKLVIPVIYDSADDFDEDEGTADVELDGDDFTINKKGEKVND